MMLLPNDVVRCHGEYVAKYETEPRICMLRETCARFVQRNTGGERTPSSLICQYGVDAYIWQEGK